jgi:methyltransferase
MTSATWFLVLIWAVAFERLAELIVSNANARWSFARGGVESGCGHYPAMIALHAGLLIAAPVEVAFGHRPFVAWLGWPMLALVAGCQALRWWCIASLGRHWNTRVIVVPGSGLVGSGPYRRLRHPNYVAVAVEGAALPLVHTAWITALVFTVLNALVLRARLKVENEALGSARRAGSGSVSGSPA